MASAQRRVVLGLGNLLNRDEGMGVAAVELLRQQVGPQHAVELIDGGVLGLDLLPLVEECSHLLVLDATDADTAAGTVIELGREAIPTYGGLKMSQHQVTFQEVLGLARIRGNLPRHLHLIGVQPGDISLGLELSPAIGAALPDVVARAKRVLGEWGLAAG